MIRYSKLFFIFILILLGLWLLPRFYRFMTDRPDAIPFTLYSPVAGDFAFLDFSRDKGTTYRDRGGHVYTERQFDSLLPFFYYRQLVSDGRLPDSLGGAALTPRQIGLSNFIFRLSAADLNAKTPALYPLLEAMSGRVNLQMPPDVFRLNRRIEFIDMESQRVDEEKSERFTQAMLNKGFRFPASCIGGNPTVKKDYDNGYFLTDSLHRLFHLKQLRGRPFFRPVPLPEGVEARHLLVREYAARKFHAFLTDQYNRFWVIDMPDYRFHLLPAGEYNPLKHDVQIVGNMLDWTISIGREDGVHLYAIHAGDYSLIDTMSYKNQENPAEQAGRWLFPCELRFTSYSDRFVCPRLVRFSPKALWLPLLIGLFCYFRYRMKKNKRLSPAARESKAGNDT